MQSHAGQSGRLKLLEFEALSDHVFGERVPPRRCEATAELSGGGGVEVALSEVSACRSGLVGFQCSRIELLRSGIRDDQAAPAAAIPLHTGTAAGVADRVTDPVGQQFHRLHEADMFHLLHECVDVATFAASEAVEMTVIRSDVERRRLLVVEGAQPLK